jgi:ribose 1,5-bisphosphokinase PhnN
MSEEDGALTLAAQADGTTYGVTDEIARRALRSGARVISARRHDIPGGGTLAAIQRYPV